MASLTATRRTSAEQRAANRNSAAKQPGAWRIPGCRGHGQLPSCARADTRGALSLRGQARAAVPTRAKRELENRDGFMAVTAAALSPRAWLLGCASGPGPRDCRVRVAAPD